VSPTRWISRTRLGCLAAVTAAVLVAVPHADAWAGPKHNPPKSVYLALGDSLAFGYQQVKFNANFPTENPAVYDTGYVDDFSKDLRSIDRRIQTINVGCPGETTDSLLGLRPCIYHPPFALHTNYTGSQIDAALAVLRAHRGQVSPVTIDIGANDLLGGATLSHIQANVSTILDKLRDAAPYTEIIVLGYYNPEINLLPASDVVVAQLNSVLAQTAAQYRAFFANPMPIFNPPVNEIPTICALTLMCTPLHDIHASDAGYQQIANVLFAASGYRARP
jgi:lysophospholipase L1-like esterase